MVLSGGGNAWTDHVRAFATKNKVSYMCAMSDPKCSATYKGRKAKPTKEQKKAKKENITMSMEDKPAPARKESLGDIFESATPFEEFNSPAIRAVLKNKGSLNKAVEKKIADQQGMLAEDVNRALPDTKGKAKGKSGRPAKYATTEEARQAKIANTIRRAKERGSEKKDIKMVARIERAKKEWEDWATGFEEPRGNMYSDGKGKRTENEHIIERIERQKKRFPSLKVSDYYRPINVIKDTKDNQNTQTISLPAELLALSSSKAGKGRPRGEETAEDTCPVCNNRVSKSGLIRHLVANHTPQQAVLNILNSSERDRLGNYMTQSFGLRPDDPRLYAFRHHISQELNDFNPDMINDGLGAVGGRRKKAFGFNDFVQGLNKLNPVMWGIQNHPQVGIKLGQVTNDNLLPAVVAVGKPVYDATAIATATTLTGNPLLGKVVADEFWNAYGKPYDPRDRQDNEALKQISERVGKEAGKEASKAGKGRPRKPRGGATSLQKGISAEMRSYVTPPLQHDLNQIIHSNDARASKFGQTVNPYRDYSNSFDPTAQRQIDKAIAVLVRQGLIPAPVMRPSAPVFVPKGSGRLGADPATYTPAYLNRPRLGADPSTYTPAYLSQGGAIHREDVLGDYSTIINHLISHIIDPSEPVDPRDYEHTIRLINSVRELKGGFYGGFYGGADEPPPPPPPPPTPEEEEFVEEEDPMAGIDWLAIGQALMQEANEANPNLDLAQAAGRC